MRPIYDPLRPILAASFSALATLAILNAPARAEATSPQLQTVIEDVARKFPQVTHVDQVKFDELQKSGNLVVIDARSPEEFATSHIDGAVNVDPKISAEDFSAKVAPALKGKTAVVYCSVGMRSSKLVQRVTDAATAAGATSVASLKGGIFAWANAGRVVVNASGPTTSVHGYDPSWGKLLEQK